jgi:hypothetical protein
MMSHKLQPFPMSSARESRVHLPVSKALGVPPENSEEAKFFRSWLVYDSDLQTTRSGCRVNWNVVLGLGLVIALSVSIWATVGLMMARLWQ